MKVTKIASTEEVSDQEGLGNFRTERERRIFERAQKKELRKMDIDQLRGCIAALERELQTSTSSKGLPFPTLYDGSEDFQQYLKNFNTLATAHSWPPARCTQILPIYLRGAAKAVYEGLCDAERTNWKSLVDALADKLKRMSSSLTARQKLAQRKQRPGETLEEFAQAVSGLVARAYPDHSLKMDFAGLNLGAHENDVRKENEKMLLLFRSGVARDFFRANMLPQLKERALYMEEPLTLEEALTQAKRVEQIQESLVEDIWKQAQGTKAEIALAEVNVVRTELNELGKRQRRWDYQRRPEHDWNEDCHYEGEVDCHHNGEEDCYHDSEEDCERDGEEDCQYDWDKNATVTEKRTELG